MALRGGRGAGEVRGEARWPTQPPAKQARRAHAGEAECVEARMARRRRSPGRSLQQGGRMQQRRSRRSGVRRGRDRARCTRTGVAEDGAASVGRRRAGPESIRARTQGDADDAGAGPCGGPPVSAHEGGRPKRGRCYPCPIKAPTPLVAPGAGRRQHCLIGCAAAEG